LSLYYFILNNSSSLGRFRLQVSIPTAKRLHLQYHYPICRAAWLISDSEWKLDWFFKKKYIKNSIISDFKSKQKTWLFIFSVKSNSDWIAKFVRVLEVKDYNKNVIINHPLSSVLCWFVIKSSSYFKFYLFPEGILSGGAVLDTLFFMVNKMAALFADFKHTV